MEKITWLEKLCGEKMGKFVQRMFYQNKKYQDFPNKPQKYFTKEDWSVFATEQDMMVDMEIKDAKENPQHYIGYEEEELENWGYGSEDKLTDLRVNKNL